MDKKSHICDFYEIHMKEDPKIAFTNCGTCASYAQVPLPPRFRSCVKHEEILKILKNS